MRGIQHSTDLQLMLEAFKRLRTIASFPPFKDMIGRCTLFPPDDNLIIFRSQKSPVKELNPGPEVQTDAQILSERPTLCLLVCRIDKLPTHSKAGSRVPL